MLTVDSRNNVPPLQVAPEQNYRSVKLLWADPADEQEPGAKGGEDPPDKWPPACIFQLPLWAQVRRHVWVK